jgi:hypothetical protein
MTHRQFFRPILALILTTQVWGDALWAQTPAEDALARLQSGSLLAALDPAAELSDFAHRADTHYHIRVMAIGLPWLLPIASTLAEGSPEDRLLGLVIEARLLWAQAREADDPSRSVARESFLRALTLAESEGYSDRQIAGLLADLAAIELTLGNPDAASAFLDRARACAGLTCPEDISSGTNAPATSRFYTLSRADTDDLVRDFFDRHLPGEVVPLARHFASQGYGIENRYPMEAATYLDRAWLTGRIAYHGVGAMNAALRANRFARVREIAAEITERGLVADLAPENALRLRRLDLRAAFRSGDPTAPAAYDALVDEVIAAFLDPARFPDRYNLPGELDRLLRDIMDTENLGAADRLSMAMVERESETYKWEQLWTRRARLLHRDGQSLVAADIIRQLREVAEIEPGSNPRYDIQEAAYARAGGDLETAERLMAPYPARDFSLPDVGDPIPPRGGFLNPVSPPFTTAVDMRDAGNYDYAVWLLADEMRFVPTFAARGDYPSAQWLWQVAFTLAIGGEPGAAFAVMSRAAAIAARLSFADPTGEAGGSLQLLQRDNWRYLLFVDIAWAAAKGRPTEALLVVSDY